MTTRHEEAPPKGTDGARNARAGPPQGSRPAEADLARVQDELARRVAAVTRLGDLGTPVSNMADVQPVLEELLRTFSALLRADAAVLMRYDA
ncbi:MAG: hypothetical protein GEU81_13355, partial [Nitriliruptorales bacterium]|nr:hypothetical protein [Nitriliruptorales bacterium]